MDATLLVYYWQFFGICSEPPPQLSCPYTQNDVTFIKLYISSFCIMHLLQASVANVKYVFPEMEIYIKRPNKTQFSISCFLSHLHSRWYAHVNVYIRAEYPPSLFHLFLLPFFPSSPILLSFPFYKKSKLIKLLPLFLFKSKFENIITLNKYWS